MSLPTLAEMTDALHEAQAQGQRLGMGSGYAVYEYPAYPDYVIRARVDVQPGRVIWIEPPTLEPEILETRFSGHNFGHALAYYGNGCTLNWRKPGTALIVKDYPYTDGVDALLRDGPRLMKILAQTEALPVSAYFDLMAELEILERHNYGFDHNASNVLISDTGFGIVDPIHKPDRWFQTEALGSLLKILTHSYDTGGWFASDESQGIQAMRFRVIGNFCAAAAMAPERFDMRHHATALRFCLRKAGQESLAAQMDRAHLSGKRRESDMIAGLNFAI